MPFMPQPQQRQNPMRIVQEIMMMKMQAGAQIKQNREQHDLKMKELDQAYKYQDLLAEDKWEREAPLRELQGSKDLIKQMETDHKMQKSSQKRKYDLKVQEMNAESAEQDLNLTRKVNALANQKERSAIDLQREQYRTQQAKAKQFMLSPAAQKANYEEEQNQKKLSDFEGFLTNNAPIWRQKANEARGSGGIFGKGTTKLGASKNIIDSDRRLIDEFMAAVKLSQLQGTQKLDTSGLISAFKEKLGEMDYSNETGATGGWGDQSQSQPKSQFQLEFERRQQYLGGGS